MRHDRDHVTVHYCLIKISISKIACHEYSSAGEDIWISISQNFHQIRYSRTGIYLDAIMILADRLSIICEIFNYNIRSTPPQFLSVISKRTSCALLTPSPIFTRSPQYDAVLSITDKAVSASKSLI
mgnify:CR=1 FL=1